MYSRALTACNEANVLDETKLFLLLRFAESLALVGNLERRSVLSLYLLSDNVLMKKYPKSMELYDEASSLMDTLDWDDKARVTAIRVKGRARKMALTAIAALSFASIQNSRVRCVLLGWKIIHHLIGKCPGCRRSSPSKPTPVDPRVGHPKKAARDRTTLLGRSLSDGGNEVGFRFDR